MAEEVSFRPKLGHLTYNLILACVLAVMVICFAHTLSSIGLGSWFLVCCLILILSPIVHTAIFYLRIKYILKDNSLTVKRYSKAIEINYTSIKSVEEVLDRSVLLMSFTPSVLSSKQIWIRYTDINGWEDMVNASPAKKEEFLKLLRSRIKDQ